MAYDFFTQPRGPDIDTSLYGDAAIAGANVGKATPSAFTSIVRGVTEGIDTGLGLVGKYQQNQIRQHNIDRQPQQDAIEDTRLKREQQLVEMQQMELDTARKLEDITLKTKTAEAQANNAIATQKLNDLNAVEGISQDLTSTDPNVRASVLTNSKYSETLLRDGKLAEGVLSRLANDPQLTPEQRAQAMGLWDYSKRVEYNRKLAHTNTQFINNAAQELDKDSKEVLASGGLSPLIQGKNAQEITGLQAYPRDSKLTDANGNIVGDAPVDSATYAPPEEYDVFDAEGRKTGITIKSPDYQKLYKLKGSFSAYNKLIGGPEAASSNARLKDRSGAVGGQPRIDLSTKIDAPESARQPDASQNESIITQRQAEFNDIAKKPPPGIANGSLETRLQEKKKAIRQKFAGFSGMTEENSNPSPTPKAVPSPIPPSANDALATFKGASVSLKTPDFKLSPVSWNRVNTNPYLKNEPALIKGVASQESGGDPDAVSPTGVVGLLQVTRDTAAMYGLNRDIPEQNVLAGKKFLYDQMIRFDNNLRLSLTAYNAGPEYVARAVRATGTTDWEPVKAYLKNVLSPQKFKEVDTYADRVIAHTVKYLNKGNKEDEQLFYLLQTNDLLAA